MRLKSPSTVAFALAASLVLAGCSGGGGSSKAAASAGPQPLTVALSSGANNLDPAAAANGNNSQWYITPAYAPLIGQDSTGKLVPGLATAWNYVGSDNTKLEVTLRPNLKFADGSPLTAQDVVASMEHFKTGPGPGSPYFKQITFATDGTNKVVLTSAVPNNFMPLLLTAKWMGGDPISPKGLADPSQLAHATFGAGPYTLDASQTVSGDHYVYVPNKNYYDQSAIHFTKITIRVIPEETSQLQALKSGQIEAMYADAPSAEAAAGSKNLSIVHKATTFDGLYLLDFNGTIAPALGDLRVRQAINYAIDRKAIVKAVYGDYGAPNDQPNIPGDDTYGYNPAGVSKYNYDPAKAKQLLAEAGYAKGFTLKTLDRANIPGDDKMLQAVASQLAEVGITLQLKPEPTTGAWISDLQSAQYPTTGQTTSGKPAVMEVPYLFLPGGITNPFNASNGPVTDAYQALAKASPAQVPALARAAIKACVDQALSAPVVALDDIFIFDNTKLSGVHFLGDQPILSKIETWTPKG